MAINIIIYIREFNQFFPGTTIIVPDYCPYDNNMKTVHIHMSVP